MKRNNIAATSSEAAPLNPVEQEVIHLFVQFSRALNHPCKIYNILAVGAPVIYIGPRPSHVTEILDELGPEYPTIEVTHGAAEELARQIQSLRQKLTDVPRLNHGQSAGVFAKGALLPQMITLLEQ